MGVNITKEQAIDLVNRGLLEPEVLKAYDGPQSWDSVSVPPDSTSKDKHRAAHSGSSHYRRGAKILTPESTGKQNKYHNHKLDEYED